MPPSRVNTTLADRCFQLLDLLGVFDLYEYFSNLFSPGLRSLSLREEKLLRNIFGESVPYARIRIDERARIGTRRYGICYVSFHTINTWGRMSDPTLVHEVVHVWQYVQLGAPYIPRALAAQRTTEGYNYGGTAGLDRNNNLKDFNLEQAAALVEDAFRLEYGYPLRYGSGELLESLGLYERYLQQVRRCKMIAPYR